MPCSTDLRETPTTMTLLPSESQAEPQSPLFPLVRAIDEAIFGRSSRPALRPWATVPGVAVPIWVDATAFASPAGLGGHTGRAPSGGLSGPRTTRPVDQECVGLATQHKSASQKSRSSMSPVTLVFSRVCQQSGTGSLTADAGHFGRSVLSVAGLVQPGAGSEDATRTLAIGAYVAEGMAAVAFLQSLEAVQFSRDLHRRYAQHHCHNTSGGPTREVCSGVYTGRARLDSGERLLMATVNRAAGLCELGRPGQVVVCDSTRSSLNVRDCDGCVFVSLGSRHLRGQERPERVWELDLEERDSQTTTRNKSLSDLQSASPHDPSELADEVSALHADLEARLLRRTSRREAEIIRRERLALRVLLQIGDRLCSLTMPDRLSSTS